MASGGCVICEAGANVGICVARCIIEIEQERPARGPIIPIAAFLGHSPSLVFPRFGVTNIFEPAAQHPPYFRNMA